MAKKKLIQKQPFRGKTLLVCGASKGIGKATAKEIVRLGGNVGIVARDPEVLHQAAQEIEAEKVSPTQFVEAIACDTTDMDALKPLFENFIDRHGVPDVLVSLVGYAYPEYVENFTLDDYKQSMDANYFGKIIPALILLPYFMEAKQGQIAFVSSALGLTGLIGYATYAPTNFALVGFAETLRHELKPYNIDITVVFPGDTDTPGFEIENRTKPPETDMISDSSAGLTSPEKVAEIFVEGMLKKKFIIIWGELKFLWMIKRLSLPLIFLYLDVFLKSARKKLGKT
jgi:3-dehydrosphinganine reductase